MAGMVYISLFDAAFCMFFMQPTIRQANSGAVSNLAHDANTIQADSNGTIVLIGPVFKAQISQSLADIALRFDTNIKTLLKFNADLIESTSVQVGQEICILPCKK